MCLTVLLTVLYEERPHLAAARDVLAHELDRGGDLGRLSDGSNGAPVFSSPPWKVMSLLAAPTHDRTPQLLVY